MPEEEQEKKKLAILKRILKWIGLSILSILLILGLIFQAPWKVITLLVIILLACIVLPKQMRKWFWLSAAVIVIALIIWVFLPDENGDWQPYTFDEELAALEAKYAIPDSENAATIYQQLLETWEAEDENEPNLPDNWYSVIRVGPWSGKDYPEIAKWVEYHQSTIDRILEASKFEKCGFPINANMITFGETTDRLAPMRQWVYLLVSAANNDMAEGRTDAGLEKYLCVIQMAKHECQQPTMIDMLVGSAIESLAIAQFKRLTVTGNATEQHLSNIEDALSEIKHDWASDLPKFLEHDKLMVKSLLSTFYEVNSKGKTRLSRDPTAAMRPHMKKMLDNGEIQDPNIKEILETRLYPTYWQTKLAKASTMLAWFFMPSTPQKAAEIIDASYEKYYAMANPDFDWQKEPREVSITSLFKFKVNYRRMIEAMTGASEGLYYNIHDTYLRVIAEQRGSLLMIALRRNKNKTGQWPKNLDDIKSLAPAEIFVDPINGNSFVYKLSEENFTLYSKGKNNIDEDGERYGSGKGKLEVDDWLIWPPRRRKTQGEKADAEQQ